GRWSPQWLRDGLGGEDLGEHAPVVAVVVAESAEGQDGRSQVGVVDPGRVAATVLDAGTDQAGPDADDVGGVAAVVPGKGGMRPRPRGGHTRAGAVRRAGEPEVVVVEEVDQGWRPQRVAGDHVQGA